MNTTPSERTTLYVITHDDASGKVCDAGLYTDPNPAITPEVGRRGGRTNTVRHLQAFDGDYASAFMQMVEILHTYEMCRPWLTMPTMVAQLRSIQHPDPGFMVMYGAPS